MKDEKEAVSMGGGGASPLKWDGRRKVEVARAISDAEGMANPEGWWHARPHPGSHTGDPQSWVVVRSARSGVIGGVRSRSAARPNMSCRGGMQLRTREEGVVSSVRLR